MHRHRRLAEERAHILLAGAQPLIGLGEIARALGDAALELVIDPAHRLLRLAHVVDVDGGAEPGDDPAVAPQRRIMDDMPAIGAVMTADAALHGVIAAVERALHPRLHQGRLVVGVLEGGTRGRIGADRVADIVDEAPVVIFGGAVGADDEGDLRQRLEHVLEALLAVAQRLLAPLVLGDVEGDADHADRPEIGVEEGAAARRHPALALAGVGHAIFDRIDAAAGGVVRAAMRLGNALAVVGMDRGDEHLEAGPGSRRHAHQRLGLIRPGALAGEHVVVPDAEAGRLHGDAQMVAAALQRLERQLAVVDIAGMDARDALGQRADPDGEPAPGDRREDLVVDRAAGGHRLAQAPLLLAADELGKTLPEHGAEQRLGPGAGELGRTAVDIDDAPIGIDGVERIGDAVERGHRQRGGIAPGSGVRPGRSFDRVAALRHCLP